ncbi:MAG: PAS domain S-box protein [Spirochaetia bacterium]|nr:PAS domain S-box protein [Spirochaetia bacterium]
MNHTAENINSLKSGDIYLKELLSLLGYIILEISDTGRILRFSKNLPETLGYNKFQLSGLTAKDIFFEQTYTDLFRRHTQKSNRDRKINYRGFMTDANGKKIFMHISGIHQEDESSNPGAYHFVIHRLDLPDKSLSLDTGYYDENLKANKIVRRYLPPVLYEQAKHAVKDGHDKIPDEVKYLTFLFADLVSFTTFAENKNPKEVMETLNLSIGAASATIVHWNGVMDKIMGDAIMAIFENPLDAVIAAVEIQKQFYMFNQLRSLQSLENLNIRIGINTGNCIYGSIGMDKYMEWTVIGDAVNSASRLEKSCTVGGILISKETLGHVKENVHVTDSTQLQVKGKKHSLEAYYIDQVSFTGTNNEAIKLSIQDEFSQDFQDMKL